MNAPLSELTTNFRLRIDIHLPYETKRADREASCKSFFSSMVAAGEALLPLAG
jgi:hypothetical protein